jgi:hypothetical protein
MPLLFVTILTGNKRSVFPQPHLTVPVHCLENRIGILWAHQQQRGAQETRGKLLKQTEWREESRAQTVGC